MSTQKSNSNPGYISSVLQCKCSRCRTGKMFSNSIHPFSTTKNMAMPTHCTSCGQALEIEVGFYYGTGYVSYALTVAISVTIFVAYWVLFGISINDNSLFYYLAVDILALIITMPYVMRLSRAIWLSFFVKYDANWQQKEPLTNERVVEGFMQKD